MSTFVARARGLALAALLVGAAPVGAQTCVESPLPPAGWSAHLRVLRAPATETEFEEDRSLPAASGIEAGAARDFHGPTALALTATSTDYEVTTMVYDPETGTFESRTLAIVNSHLSARLAFDLVGAVPICPFVEAGFFRAHADGATGSDADDDAGGVYVATGWTYQPRWVLSRTAPGGGPPVEASAFATARLLVISASSIDLEGYGNGSEVLPKLAFRAGASVTWHWLFLGADLGMIFPAADPDFWGRHNSADERAAPSFGVRAGVLF